MIVFCIEIIFQRNCLGSDCRGVENLLLVDANTLTFKSDQFLYFFDVNTKVLTSIKCSEQSIGAITVGSITRKEEKKNVCNKYYDFSFFP